MELIRMEMTPKERILSYAAGKEVDRIPTSLSAGETISPLYGIDMRDYYFSADRMVEVESRMAADFEADNMGMGLGLRTLVEALGSELKYTKRNVSYILNPALKSLKDVEGRPLVNVEKDGRLPIMLEAFERLIAQFGEVRIIGSGLAGPFTTASGLIGTEAFLKATVKNPEGLHRLLRYSTDNVIHCCREMNRILGIKFMLSEPMASKNLLSKKQFHEFFIPYLKETVSALSEFQGAPSIHICGNTKDRWQEVVDTGISGFWVDNCESLAELKKAFGYKIGISGNVIPVDTLRNGTPQDIVENVKACLHDGADNPCGFTLCPGCTTPIDTPRENMIALMNAASTYGKGAVKGKPPKGITKINS